SRRCVFRIRILLTRPCQLTVPAAARNSLCIDALTRQRGNVSRQNQISIREVDENEIQSSEGGRWDAGAPDDRICADYHAANGADRNNTGTERHDNDHHDRGDDNGPAVVSAAAGRVAGGEIWWLEKEREPRR